MTPSQLKPESFEHYPPEGRRLATQYLSLLRQMPLAILPTFLRDLKEFDWKFPAEQNVIRRRLSVVDAHPETLQQFSEIKLSSNLFDLPWAREPQILQEALTAFLWSSHQMDLYRVAAVRFVAEISPPDAAPRQPPFIIILLGKDAQPSSYPLFERLLSFGQLWTRLNPENASRDLWTAFLQRTQANDAAYRHWYIEGGEPLPFPSRDCITSIAYPALAPMKKAILERISASITMGSGPEQLRSGLGRLAPSDVAADSVTRDPRLQHFLLSLLTQDSGTQIFSTSFVQLATQEILQRAEPASMFIRHAPRLRQMAFNAMVAAASAGNITTDPQGSLIDADMAAYYAYLRAKNIAAAQPSSLIAWFEGTPTAFIAGPGIPAGTTTDRIGTISDLLRQSA